MDQADGNPPVRFEVHLPDDLVAGAYANQLSVWHTGHEFTLDFTATQMARPVEDETGQVTHVVVPSQVVARVKIPPGLVFELLRTINENMSNYEQRFGPIQRPGDDGPLLVPDDLLGQGQVDDADQDPETGDRDDEGE